MSKLHHSSSYITSRRETHVYFIDERSLGRIVRICLKNLSFGVHYLSASKSFVFHVKGCSVFDSDGKLVYRIDNYCGKSSRDDVDLMDLRGNVLFYLRPQKKTPVFGSYIWDGYKVINGATKVEQRTPPCFHVRKNRKVLRESIDYDVVSQGIEGDHETTTTTCYRIQGSSEKRGFRITDGDGILLAEVEQKRSSSTGVIFGKDVLNLVVEPHVDHSLMMAFVSAFQLINHNLKRQKRFKANFRVAGRHTMEETILCTQSTSFPHHVDRHHRPLLGFGSIRYGTERSSPYKVP